MYVSLRAREFNPGHAPHHRGIGVTPPGLGRENPGGYGGLVAPRVGVAPHSGPQLAPRGVRGEMRPVPSGGRRLPLPGGLRASSLLTGILQAWRGACCLKTGKEQAPGPFPGGGVPVLSRRPVLAQMRRSGGAIVMAIGASSRRGSGRGPRPRAAWSSGEGSRHGSSGRLTRMLVNVGIRASPRSRHGSSAGISAAWSDGRRGLRLSRGPRPGGLSSHGQP